MNRNFLITIILTAALCTNLSYTAAMSRHDNNEDKEKTNNALVQQFRVAPLGRDPLLAVLFVNGSFGRDEIEEIIKSYIYYTHPRDGLRNEINDNMIMALTPRPQTRLRTGGDKRLQRTAERSPAYLLNTEQSGGYLGKGLVPASTINPKQGFFDARGRLRDKLKNSSQLPVKQDDGVQAQQEQVQAQRAEEAKFKEQAELKAKLKQQAEIHDRKAGRESIAFKKTKKEKLASLLKEQIRNLQFHLRHNRANRKIKKTIHEIARDIAQTEEAIATLDEYLR